MGYSSIFLGLLSMGMWALFDVIIHTLHNAHFSLLIARVYLPPFPTVFTLISVQTTTVARDMNGEVMIRAGLAFWNPSPSPTSLTGASEMLPRTIGVEAEIPPTVALALRAFAKGGAWRGFLRNVVEGVWVEVRHVTTVVPLGVG